MVLFCSAHEFDSLCLGISDKADFLRLQAKGGSMHPFIRSNDWVNVALCKGRKNEISKGDIILFRKDDSLYLHRVLRKAGDGFLVKGDMSFGEDGVILLEDVLAKVISIQRGARRIDLCTAANCFISALIADSSLFLQYPFLFSRKMGALALAVFSRIQSLKVYRRIVKNILNGCLMIRVAGLEDEEQLRDLYLMAGQDIREGIAAVKKEGFWLVAERKGRIVAGLTMTQFEKDVSLWIIFGLEVKLFFRGLGIGRKLVEEAVLKAKEAGAKEIGLFVNKKSFPALKLYRQLGFVPTEIFPPEFNCAGDELYLSYKINHCC